MKKILFIILLFSLRGISQTPSGYTKLNVKYDFTAIKTDSGFHIPGYSTVPNIRTGIWVGSGNLGLDTILHRFYYYSDGWRGLVNLADSVDLNHYATQYDLSQLTISGGNTASNGIELSGTDIRLGNVSPTGSALTRDAYIYGNSLYGVRFNNARFAQDTGTRVTSANSLTLGKDGNIFYISDTTRIKGIDTIGWQAGSIVHLFFLNYNKIIDSTTVGAGMAKIYLDGNEDSVVFQPGDYLSLMYNGGVWNEIGRKSRKSLVSYNIYNKDSTFTSNRTASLNGKFFKIYDGVGNNFIIDPVEKQYFLGNQESDIYSYLNMRDSVATLNAGNNVLESTVKLSLDALNIKATMNVNGTEMLNLNNQSGAKATINSDSLYLKATASGASVGNVWTLLNPSTGSGHWASGTQSKSAFWEFPAAADTIVMLTTTAAITITSIKSVCTGGSSASVTFQVYQGYDRSSGTAVLSGAATTTSITTVESDTSFNDATVPANTQIWIVITAGAGNGINFNINYTND
jgi:hypothetical protein